MKRHKRLSCCTKTYWPVTLAVPDCAAPKAATVPVQMANPPDVCSPTCELYAYNPTTDVDELPNLAGSPVSADKQAVVPTRIYTPIKAWQTRILELLPGSLGTNLEARLHVTYMTEDPGMVLRDSEQLVEYSALSYYWGVPVYDHIINITDILYPVTETLFRALQRLRSTSAPRYFWIDALCIQQFDLAERSCQVANMLQIYKKAGSVIIWLGEHDMDTRIVFDYAERGVTVADADSQSPCLCASHIERLARGLTSIASRPWLSRIWVKQEVWASNGSWVHCESSSVHWTSFIGLETQGILSTRTVLQKYTLVVRYKSSSLDYNVRRRKS